MNTSTAILLVAAAGLVGLVIGRATVHCASAPSKGWADVVAGGFGLGKSLVDWANDDDDEDSR